VAVVLLLWFALALAGLVREPRVAIPKLGSLGARLAASGTLGSRYAFGLATGLLPCGLVYAALALPVSLGSAGGGALAMLAFGLGTVPALATLSAVIQRILRRGLWPRRILALLVLASGLWAVAQRLPERGSSGVHAHEE
jgi:sulfite exporter TauE/SafE